MKKIIGMLTTAMIYFCVATVVAQAVGIIAMWSKGHLGGDRTLDLLSTIHGLPTSADTNNTPEEEREPQVVYEEVLDRRALASLDLSLRTSAMDNALSEILLQQSRLNESRRQYSEMLTQFESRLNETRTGATDRALKDVQSTLEDLTPIQAKEQIVKMMQAGLIDNVVEVLKAMSPDKRKKITAVFADDDEEFYKIIERMLTGSEGSLIDRTKEQVDAIKEQQT
jgi:hypothetical protein